MEIPCRQEKWQGLARIASKSVGKLSGFRLSAADLQIPSQAKACRSNGAQAER